MDVETYRDALLRKRNELLGGAAKPLQWTMENNSGRQGDMADQASGNNEVHIQLKLKQTDAKILQAIEEALQRVEAGTFGLCRDCGLPIADARLDAIVVGMPWKHHHAPRERLNPITVATVALGLALRLWRDAFPVVEGGTAVLLHGLARHFGHGSQDPYRELFLALRDGRTAADLAEDERAAATDRRALEAYRARPWAPRDPAPAAGGTLGQGPLGGQGRPRGCPRGWLGTRNKVSLNHGF